MAEETDYKTKIEITGDSQGAENSISRTSKAIRSLLAPLTAVRGAIAAIGRAMGLFYLAASGVQMVVGLYQKLHEWIGKAAKEARELADRMKMDSIATSVANTAEAYKRLTKEMAEANRLEKERNAILDARKVTTRDLEDANLEQRKQLEIARLDPMSKTYAEDRAAIERRYAREAANVTSARAQEDSRAGAQRLYAEAAGKDRDANRLEGNYNAQMRQADRLREMVWSYGMQARRGVEGAQERHDATEQKYNAVYDAAQKTKEAMEALRKEAETLRARAGEMTGGFRAANIRNETALLKIDIEERDAAAKKAQEEEAQKQREAEQKQREAEQQQREAARADAEKRREADRQAGQLERQIAGYQSGIASVAPSGNRLTAMGLGSGSGVMRVQEQMAKSLRDLVQASQDQLVELRAIKDAPNVGVFGE